MIYIYDLLFNWDEDIYYNFFEWEDNDELEYIKKVPIFRISNFNDLVNNVIKVDSSFLNKIYNKTEIYNNKYCEKVKYCCLLCNQELNKAIAIEFDDVGKSIYRSNISFFDLEDVFNLARKVNVFKLSFDILSSFRNSDIYLTRLEKVKKKYLIREINNSYDENNIDKLKYIYYELFDEDSESIDLIREKIVNSLDNNFSEKHELIYNLIKTPNFL